MAEHSSTERHRGRNPSVRFQLLLAVLCYLILGTASPSALADYLITAFDETYYPTNPENNYGGFKWGDFNFTGAVIDGASSLTLDITNLDGQNNVAGGIGVDYPLHDFNPSQAQWEVRLKVLPGNAATAFRTTYLDDDGLGTPPELRRGTEYRYDFSLSGLAVNQWHVLTKPFTTVSSSGTPGQWDAGDGVQNPDLSQIQLQSVFGSTGRLNVEFDYIRVNGLGDPPPPYPGAEANAPWRAEAATRIDAIRKADLHVTVTDALGNRLPDADVGVHMQKHEFGFGSAVAGDRLASTSPAQNTYKQKVEELFNMATVENHLKWPPWEGEWGATFSQTNAIAAVNWLDDHEIDIRGHVMVWPGYSNLPNSVKNILDGGVTAAEEQPLRNLIDNHIDDVGSQFAGQLVAWDVVNEERTNHDIMDQLPEGDHAMVDWFQRARNVDPQAKLYINEWGILSSSGDTNSSNQQQYYNTINYLKSQNAQIDGIGFQGHFDESTLTGPEGIWEILDHFQELDLDMQVSEFDFDTDDESLQAMYTRDFLTAVFAHEGMDDFVMWGFWEGAHWKPEAAMFRNDWSIKPNGEQFIDLVFNQWWTDEDEDADESGEATVRAFKGEHEVSVEWGEFSDDIAATLSDGGLELEVALPFLLGDYNRDGAVDTADFVVWSKTLNTPVTLAGTGADGNHDGFIDLDDYATWLQHLGNVMPGGGGAANVPEPASAILLLSATALFSVATRRPRARTLAA